MCCNDTEAKVWIASFPRSGNHRTREAIYSLLFNRPFEYELVEKGSSLLIKALEETRDAGYKKTHKKAGFLDGPVIYLVRHPLEVALSWNKFIPSQTPQMAADFVANGRRPEWGSWAQNVESFIDRPDTLIIRYEDWGTEALKKICDFCGLPYNERVLYWNHYYVILEKERELMKTAGPRYHQHLHEHSDGEVEKIFSREHIDQIISACSETMKKVGYGDN